MYGMERCLVDDCRAGSALYGSYAAGMDCFVWRCVCKPGVCGASDGACAAMIKSRR